MACAALAEAGGLAVPLSDDAPGRAFAAADDTAGGSGSGADEGVYCAPRDSSPALAHSSFAWPVTIRGWKG